MLTKIDQYSTGRRALILNEPYNFPISLDSIFHALSDDILITLWSSKLAAQHWKQKYKNAHENWTAWFNQCILVFLFSMLLRQFSILKSDQGNVWKSMKNRIEWNRKILWFHSELKHEGQLNMGLFSSTYVMLLF